MFRKRPDKLSQMPPSDEYGRLTIHYAALDSDVERLKRCVSAGESVDQVDLHGFTPLHFAAQQGALSAVRVLCELKADPNLANIHGNTPLWTAVFESNKTPAGGEIVGLIIDAGADPDHRNHAGKTPREMAVTFGGEEIARRLG